jgi:hypothetical protein
MYCTNFLGRLAITLSLFAHLINAIVLQDLPHFSERRRIANSTRLLNRQVNHQALELQSIESFFWGGLYTILSL